MITVSLSLAERGAIALMLVRLQSEKKQGSVTHEQARSKKKVRRNLKLKEFEELSDFRDVFTDAGQDHLGLENNEIYIDSDTPNKTNVTRLIKKHRRECILVGMELSSQYEIDLESLTWLRDTMDKEEPMMQYSDEHMDAFDRIKTLVLEAESAEEKAKTDAKTQARAAKKAKKANGKAPVGHKTEPAQIQA